jgi:hypothetical protein
MPKIQVNGKRFYRFEGHLQPSYGPRTGPGSGGAGLQSWSGGAGSAGGGGATPAPDEPPAPGAPEGVFIVAASIGAHVTS